MSIGFKLPEVEVELSPEQRFSWPVTPRFM